ncbi:uncharacterized protein LOC381272 isoform 1 [Mus musculus]|uniref:RIKEN cDNA A630095N17 gene n=2 Tax=Mus musculus TaxID=10090 RepID=J3KMM7_MOUSE|nr:uncharacterized protein LOC381272 isoform 1 [Mus musculus]|eukprot:NP_001230019.1 uncharacterized protein LOC381272 isoform 1 [Mus musculus]
MAENPTFGDKDRFLTQQRRGPRLGTWLRSLPAGASCEAMTPRQPFVILREDVISLLMPEEKAGNTGVIGAISPMLTSNWRRPSPNHGARDQTQNFTNDDSMLPTELHTQPLPTKFS